MAVLIEGYSIVINKAEATKKADALSLLSSVDTVLHPMAVCSDNDLLRIGFIDLKQAKEFVAILEGGGLVYKSADGSEERATDMVMVTQFGELDVACSWLSIQFSKLKDNTLICLATFNDSKSVKEVAFPKGWTLELSLLKRFYDERIQYMGEHYVWVRSDAKHDVYRHKETGKEVHLLKLVMTE
jgi:hypothetical protein